MHRFFLFGPRGTGDLLWARTHYPDAIYLDLLDVDLFTRLRAVLLFAGSRRYRESLIDMVPLGVGLRTLGSFLE